SFVERTTARERGRRLPVEVGCADFGGGVREVEMGCAAAGARVSTGGSGMRGRAGGGFDRSGQPAGTVAGLYARAPYGPDARCVCSCVSLLRRCSPLAKDDGSTAWCLVRSTWLQASRQVRSPTMRSRLFAALALVAAASVVAPHARAQGPTAPSKSAGPLF